MHTKSTICKAVEKNRRREREKKEKKEIHKI